MEKFEISLSKGDMFTITVQNYGIFVVTQTNYESLKIGDEVRL